MALARSGALDCDAPYSTEPHLTAPDCVRVAHIEVSVVNDIAVEQVIAGPVSVAPITGCLCRCRLQR